MNAAIEELYSLLVPLSNERLIVPRACVAEVVRYTIPDSVVDAPLWFLGRFSWGGRDLPLISFEATLNAPVPESTGRTRIVVFYATSNKMRGQYFGVVTQGFPQLVRVNSEVLKLDDQASVSADIPVLCHVRMINEYPLIPDLEQIESMLAELE